jgi:hypothetical protein
LLLHLGEGMQLTLVMRTVRTWRPEAFCAGLEGAGLARVGEVPPGLAAFAGTAWPKKQHSSAEATAARRNMDRWGALFAKENPSAPENLMHRVGGHRP